MIEIIANSYRVFPDTKEEKYGYGNESKTEFVALIIYQYSCITEYQKKIKEHVEND